MDTNYINSKQLAKKFKSTPQTVYKLRREGKIPSIKFGGKILFNPEAVEAAVKESSNTQIKHQHA